MYPKTFFEKSGLAPKVGTCFVAMPFAKEFDVVFANIRKALEGPRLNFSCTRTDELLGGGHIIEDILRGIGECEVVVVDVTGRNPNVFYELGIAHMIKSVDKVVLLSQELDSIPFDLRPFRHILYQVTDDGLETLCGSLEEAIASVADRIHRIEVDGNCVGKLDYKLMGRDHYLYGFEILHGGFGYNSAKLQLRVTRYTANREPETVFEDAYGLNLNETRPIAGTGWSIALERVSNDAAFFRISDESYH